MAISCDENAIGADQSCFLPTGSQHVQARERPVSDVRQGAAYGWPDLHYQA